MEHNCLERKNLCKFAQNVDRPRLAKRDLEAANNVFAGDFIADATPANGSAESGRDGKKQQDD